MNAAAKLLNLKLRRPVADLRVLHQDDPLPLAGIAQPLLVGEALTDALAVHAGHDVDDGAGGAEGVRHDAPAEAAVDEELRRRGGGNPDHVLHLLGGNAEVAGDLLEAVAGLEAIDEILDTCPAVDDERLPERLARIDRDLCAGAGQPG